MDDLEYEGYLFHDSNLDYSDGDLDSDIELEEVLYSSVHYASQLSVEQNLTDNHNISLNEEEQLKTEEKWHINNADLGIKIKKYPSKRYYDVDADVLDIICYFCQKIGHVARDCSKPKSCYLCGDIGHIRRCCPNDLCYNCRQAGHKIKECKLPKIKLIYIKCSRCDLWGHKRKECTEIWRQYHYTTIGSGVVKPESELTANTFRYCYNCASSKHFGVDCREKRYSKLAIHSQFIANYSRNSSYKSNISKTKTNVKSNVKIREVIQGDEKYENMIICNKKSLNSYSSNFFYLESDDTNEDTLHISDNHPHKKSKNVYQLNELESNMNNETSDVSKNRSNDQNNILKRGNGIIDNISTDKETRKNEKIKTISCKQSHVPVIISDIDDLVNHTDSNIVLENNSVSISNVKKMTHINTHCNTNPYTRDKNIESKYSVLRDLGIVDDSYIKGSKIKGKVRELNGSNEKGSLFGETVQLIKSNDMKEKVENNPVSRYNVKSDLHVTCKQGLKQFLQDKESDIDNLKSQNKGKAARKVKPEKYTNKKIKAIQEPNSTSLDLDHETLRNVYKILGDSSDEGDKFDTTMNLASVPLLTNISVDTNEEFENTNFEKSDALTPPLYTRNKNYADSDGTRYNPTELHSEDLDAYGMTSNGLITISKHKLESDYVKCDNRKREKRQKLFQNTKTSLMITRKDDENVCCKKKKSDFRKKKRSEFFRKKKRSEKGIFNNRVILKDAIEKINSPCGS